jgi:hypothetical protein
MPSNEPAQALPMDTQPLVDFCVNRIGKVRTLAGQLVFGIALGYQDLNDHDPLRHDPMMAILAGKLTARREDCAPVASKLNRLELSRPLASSSRRPEGS